MPDPFLTEAAIRERVLALRDAIRDGKDEACAAALADLAINALIDLRRIADAAETVATQPAQHFHPGPGHCLIAADGRVLIEDASVSDRVAKP